MRVQIGQRVIDLGEATEEQTEALFKEALALCQEPFVLETMRQWLKDNNLEGELE